MAPPVLRRSRQSGWKRAPRHRRWELVTPSDAGFSDDEAGPVRQPLRRARMRARQAVEEELESESSDSSDSDSDSDLGSPPTPSRTGGADSLPAPSPSPLPPPLPPVEGAQPTTAGIPPSPPPAEPPTDPSPPADGPLSTTLTALVPPGESPAEPPPGLDIPINDGPGFPDGEEQPEIPPEDSSQVPPDEQEPETPAIESIAEPFPTPPEPNPIPPEETSIGEVSLSDIGAAPGLSPSDSATSTSASSSFSSTTTFSTSEESTSTSSSSSASPPLSTTTVTGVRESAHSHGTSSSWGSTATAMSNEDNGAQMDPDVQHALIAVGSIGCFIFASFIFWLIWKFIKKYNVKRREEQTQAYSDSMPPPPPPKQQGDDSQPGIIGRIPVLRKLARGSGWRNLGENRMNEPPPKYEKGQLGESLRLETGLFMHDVKTAVNQPHSASSCMSTPADPYASAHIISPTSTMLGRTNTLQTTGAQQGTFQSADNFFLDPMAAEFAARSSDSDPRSRHVGGEAHVGRPELTGAGVTHSQDHRPRNQRMSEVSSISSGFGDGDIIVPAMTTLRPPPPAASQPPGAMEDSNNADRYSWASKAASSRRETVYTETSEDMPARFRTVNSWVNQQTGRVKRAQDRAAHDESAPPVPALPPEQRFDLMMPDGEEPRRPEGYGNRTR